ncbi:MAG TPA: efflux RND transporter periplasmic adaptor subunit [Stenotrophomonas sp.]|jgi:cobalt-zinc-cadmium efflux system membrane fusion protein
MNLLYTQLPLAAMLACGCALLVACGSRDTSPAEAAAAVTASAAPGGQTAQDTAAEEIESTVIDPAAAEASGIRVAPATAGTIATELEVQGRLTAIDGSVAQVTARYPGRIQSLRANVGDAVRAGQVLATIESNLSLSTYSVVAPRSGVVVDRPGQVGGGAAEGQRLLEIADPSRVWVDLDLFGEQLRAVQAGATVDVARIFDGEHATTQIERVLPGVASASQSAVARAVLANHDGLWRAGTAVNARVATARHAAAVVVPRAALQTMDGHDAVFVRLGQTYQVRAVKLGAQDSQNTEILEGLRAGEAVVVAQSYLVKADIEKSGADHAH